MNGGETYKVHQRWSVVERQVGCNQIICGKNRFGKDFQREDYV